uniref:Uncharacterized protein n=1 Tax=Aegilops tauschii TaxID=37682 RepID=N1QUE1_AEGTA
MDSVKGRWMKKGKLVAASPLIALVELYVGVLKASDPTQVEAKEVRLSDIAPITLDDTDVRTERDTGLHIIIIIYARLEVVVTGEKIDEITELNIAEDFDNRTSKKASIS